MHPSQEFAHDWDTYVPFEGMELKNHVRLFPTNASNFDSLIDSLASSNFLLLCRTNIPEQNLLVVTHRSQGRTHFTKVFVINNELKASTLDGRWTQEAALLKARDHTPANLHNAIILEASHDGIQQLETRISEFVTQHAKEINEMLPRVAPFDPFHL